MVAVFTGNGLGLFNTSLTQLGLSSGGSARLGQSRGSQYVNLATGNLVLQDLDELMLVRGLSAGFLRTYNSRGTVAGQGQDGWVTGFERNVSLTGTLNTAGSTMTLTTGDGQSVVFTYSGTANRYTTTGGEGAHDTLVWNSTSLVWTYTEGSTRREELYADHASATLKGRLTRIRDLKTDGTTPAQFDVVYDANGRITEVRSIDGAAAASRDALVFTYNTAGQLASVSTREGGVLKGQVTYGYENADGSGRLIWVQTDLTPTVTTDNTWDATTLSNNDGKRFRTSYTYASTTQSDLRIAGVTTSDGQSVSYTYESDGAGGWRVKTVTRGSGADGSTQTTSFTYGANTTDVVDGSGRTWTYEYDASKQLIAVREPAVSGLRQETRYTYDTSGNLIRVAQAASVGGAALVDTVFRYDTNGNRTLQRDLQGNTIAWTYNANQQVLTETRYTVADADGLDPNHTGTTNLPSGALTTNYVYDSRSRLRFVVNAAGEVREFTYATSGTGIGQVASERRYLGATYSGSYTETALNTWATNATALRKANSALTTYTYDAKGRLSQTAQYAAVTADVNGTGVLDVGTSLVSFTYDAQGLLRQRITVHGVTRTVGGAAPAGSEVVDYLYDGMGRLLGTLQREVSTAAMPDWTVDPTGFATWQAANDATTVLSTIAYVDSANQIRVTTDAGMTRTESRNRAGVVTSVNESGVVSGATVNRTTQNFFDATGRLRASQDAAGARSYFFYDTAGRLVATVDGTGAVSELRYDGIGRQAQTVAYATRVDTSSWLSGSTVTKDTLVYAATAPALAAGQAWVQTVAASDRNAYRSYDTAGRLSTETDAAGVVTTYAYDAADRVLSRTVSKPGDATVTARVTRSFYDNASRLVATLDAEGYLSEVTYDAGGRVVKTTRYATRTSSTYWANGTLAQLRPALDPAKDQTTRLFYDARGNQIGSLDAEGYLTEFVYDEAANQRAVKAYAKQLTGLTGSETFATLKTAATTGAPTEAFRLTQRSFNGLGQVTTELNHEGTVTRYSYDEAGRLVRTESAYGTSEVREGNVRYDVFGNVIGEMGGEQAAKAVVQLGKALNDPSLTPAQLDAIYAQYGVRHSHDLLGRRIESIDAQGNKTWMFHDAQGRPTFTVRGVHDSVNIQNALGEVTETRYDAFGQVIDAIAYTGRITLASPGSRASVASAIATLTFVAASDSRLQMSYDQRGLLTQRIDAEGYRTRYGYTAFGDVKTQQDLEADGVTVRRTLTSTWDNRGQMTGVNEAGGSLSRNSGVIYDAFGRVTTQTDGRGNTVTLAYDRLGRLVSRTANAVSGRNETVTMAYDAYGRTVSTTDALGKTTTYVHSDSARSLQVTTPEGVTVTTVHNRFGQTVTVSQPLPDGSTATTTTVYDRDGNVTSVTDPLNRAVTSTYDSRGLLLRTTDGSGRAVEYTYDAAGRVLTRVEDPGAGKLNLTTTMVYDGQGRQVRVTDASGRVTTMAYDRKGQLTETVQDPTGLALRTTYTWDRDGRQLTVTEGAGSAVATTTAYQYDALGRRTAEVRGSGSLNLTTTYAYDENDNVVTKTDASGKVTRFAYDAANRLRFTVDGMGGVTEVVYDAAGRATMTRRYAKAANIAALALAPAESAVLALVTAQTLVNDSLDEVVYQIHDRDGRVLMTVNGAGNVTEIDYDSAGRKVSERRYAQAVAMTTTLRDALKLGTATVDTVRTAAGPNAAKDLQARYVYDAAGQVVMMLDAVGAVTRTWYDAAGRVVAVRRHATTVNLAGITDATTPAQLQALLVDAASDLGEYRVYDGAGRVRFILDLAGTIQRVSYDAAGRTTQTHTFAALMTIGGPLQTALRAGTAVETDFSTFVTTNEAAARSQYVVYDAAGRTRYTVVRSAAGVGQVSELQYDAAGRVVLRSQYGVTIAFDPTRTESQVGTAISNALAANPGQVRTLRTVYDAAGRQHFQLDATGAVMEMRYDGAGRVTDTIAYGVRPSPGLTSDAQLTTWAQGQSSANYRRTRSTYDAAGRLETRVDALNQTERFSYDGADRLLTRTDRNNAVWTYQYDAAGRKVAEFTPQVTVNTVDASGNITPEIRSIVTRYTYDGLGSVLTKIDNADAPVTTDRRTTQYVYDNRGYQVRTIFPDAGAVNVTTGALEATGVQATIEITYNALGQAVVQKDVRGHHSYRTYDTLGRLAYEVDQENNVTTYGYNAFGEQTTLRRHAAVLNTVPLAGWSAGQALSLAQLQTAGVVTSGATDRTITTQYDLLGRRTQVQQSAVTYYRNDGTSTTGSPTTALVYNAYGDLAEESVLLEGTTWATAYRYYDALGRVTLAVDGMGYVTETKYNATGEATETIEYARALTQAISSSVRPGLPAPGDATTGYDRVSRWTYDALGRKSTETAVRHYQRVDGSTGVRDVQASFGYDNEGRLTQITNDSGTTITAYDALGRTTSVREPTRDVVVTAIDTVLGGAANRDLTTAAAYQQRSPYTAMAYDAFGNTVQVRRYANGHDGVNTPAVDAARDQVQVIRYDWQGRAVWERDGEGAVVTRAYDAADHLTEVRYTLTGNENRSAVVRVVNSYDKTGRQLSSSTYRDQYLSGAYQSSTVDGNETVVYNAFGEIVQKTHGSMSGVLSYGYDAAGRLISSNESGGVRSYGYNLAGHLVRQSQTAYLSATDGSVTAVTRMQVDKLGRAREVTLPSHTAVSSATSTVTQQFDRWGNVVQVIDARGYQTDNQYNDMNQLVRQTRPLVKVVAENGAETWQRPVNHWYYDALGRLVATRDANGNVRTNEYDAVGQLRVSRDAYGNATRHAYDVLGNARISQNALGYLTFKEYDRLGRVKAIGDYLPSQDGQTRVKATIQQYTLDENGNRRVVTNALGYSASYDYDSRQNLVRSRTSEGVVMSYAYDLKGQKIRESNALSGATGSLTDRDGESVFFNESSWDYDVFGRLVDRNNLSGRDSNYSYDAASGQLTSESAAGGLGITSGTVTRTTSYYANGRVREVVEGATRYRYEYDAAGNRTVEEVTTTDVYGLSVHTLTRTTYDSNNRIERVTQDDLVAGKRVFDLITDYDANGNRRRVRASSGYGPNVDGIGVTNTAPEVIRTVDEKVVRKGLTSQFRLLFTDIFRDREQDALTLSITQADGSALPAWLVATRDANTGEIVFQATPGAGLADQDITVKLTATESANAANTISTTFVVRVRSNTTPTLAQAGDVSVQAKTNKPWNMDLVASEYFRDPDVGDTLSLSLMDALPSWLQADTSNPDVIRLSGTPTVSGTYVLRLRATDQQGASVIKQFVITTAPNQAPALVAAPTPVEAILTRQFDWTRDLSQVFVDPEGDALQVSARLSDGSALPSWLSFQYLYDQAQPELKFTGLVPATEVDGRVYSIVLTATDVDGAVRTTTLTVTVRANRAPAPTVGDHALPSLRVNDNYSQTLPLSLFFNDPENDALAITPIWPQGSTLPAWLRVTVDYVAKTVTFSGRPTLNTQAGNLSFQLRATDVAGLTGTKNFTLNIGTDNAPTRTAVALSDRTLSIGRSFSYTLPDGLFTDADGDPLTLTAALAVQEHESEPGFEWWYVNEMALPAWLTFNAATRTFSGVVPAGEPAGAFVVRVRAVDSRGRVSLANENYVGGANTTTDGDIVFNLQSWVNTAPVYNGGLTSKTLVHGGAVNIALPGGAFTEPDGDALSYSAQVLIGSTWTNISALGLSIHSATGQITGTATNLTQSSYSARIVASDGSLTGTGTFTFNVTNTPPTAGTIPTQTAGRNQAFSANVSGYFSDVNGSALSFSATGLPAGLSISTAGVISGTTTAALGNYPVTVTANDGWGGTVSASFTLTVANSAPVAPAIANQTAPAGAWSFTVPAFTDPNGDALTYSASGLPGWMSFNTTTRVLSGTAGVVGSWTITVTATDTAGATASRSFTVTTPSAPPVYTPGTLANQTAQPAQAFSYTIPANTFTDPNGDVLTWSADGNGAALPGWLSFNAATRTFSGTPTTAGTWTIRVLASDGTNQVGQTFTISTPNVGPVYNGSLTTRVAPSGTAVSWTLAGGTFTDPNNDGLTYTLEVEQPGYWETYWIAPGEPESRWVEPVWVSASAVGLSIAANGTISGTLQGRTWPGDFNTTQTVYNHNLRIVARDPSNAIAIGAFTAIANVAPTAPTISRIILAHNTPVSTTLAAFTDVNGGTLTYTASNLPPGLTFNASTRVISGTGTTKGDWTVTYTATDAYGVATSTTFTLTVGTDTAPVRTGVALSDRTLSIGRSFSYTLPDGLFVDNDGDSLTLGASLIVQMSEVEPGTPTFYYVDYQALPAWLTFNAATRTFSGTVPAGQSAGTIIVRVQATDSRGRVSVANEQFVGGANNVNDGDIHFNIQPWVNTAPVYNGGLGNPTLVHGGAVNIALPGGTFTEPDGDALSYSAQVLIGSTWTNISALGLSINSATGQITGTATNLTQSSYSARIVASDGSLTGTGTFTFNVTNTPPTAGTIPTQTAGRNQAFSVNVSGYFADVNGSALSFSATGLPAGLSISTAGVISGTTTAALGNYPVTVTANDGWGGTVSASFTLTVANSAPVAPAIANQTAPAGAWSFTVPAFTDPNGDALTYTASGLPGWMSFNTTTRVLSGTAGVVGSWTITVTATDPAGATASRSFTVTTPSAPPVYTPGTLANQTAQPAQAFSYTIPANTFTDPNGDVLTWSADGNGAALPGWLSFNAATRTFSGTPTTAGTWTIRVLASDGTNQVGQTFTISTPNVGPVYNGSLTTRVAPSGTAVSWTLAGGTFVDPNNDGLTYTLEVEQPGYWETYWIAPGEPESRWVDPVWVSASAVGLSIAANGTISGTLQGRTWPGDFNTTQTVYNHNLRIVARDPSNAIAIGAFTAIANVAPTAPSIARIILAHNTPVSTTLAAFTDANGGTLTYTATNLPPGLTFNASTRVISGTGTTKGDWTVTYTATDAYGVATSTTFTLTVGTDTAPVRTGVALSDRTLSIGRSFSYTLPDGLFVDNDGDSLTLGASMIVQMSEVEPGTPTFYYVDYQALPAWLTFNAATRTFSGTVPAGQSAGTIIVRVQATDSRGRVSVANEQFVGGANNVNDGDIHFNIQPWVNTAPVYNGGLGNPTLVHGGAVNIALPGGAFTEPDGDALSYSAQVLIGSTWTNISALGLSINSATGQITGTATNLTQSSYSARIVASDGSLTGTGTFTFNVTNTPPTAGTIPAQTAGRNQAFSANVSGYFSDVNGSALSFTATGLPAGLSISTAGVISGTTTAALGNYPVTVTAADGWGGTVSASFTLTVANSAPVAPAIANQTAPAGAWSFTVPAFTDPNGDALTYSASGLPGWMSFNTTTRVLSGTAGVVGSWTITVTATDPAGATASRSFTVTTPSAPPVYNGGLVNQSASPGVGFSYTVPAGAFTDPNGDALTWSADGNGAALPGWLSFNAATRTFSGTPSSAGTWTIRVMASDGTTTTSATFTISTANAGPTYGGNLPTRTGSNGAGVSWTLPGGAFTDPNGDALTYTLEVERPGYWELFYHNPSEPDYRWVDPVWIPASNVGLSIASNGTVSGTLQGLLAPADYTGGNRYYYNYNMRITARDPASLSASGTFAVNVNIAPTAVTVGTQNARQNVAFSATLPVFNDANGDALSYSVSNLPPGVSFNPSTRQLGGTPTTAGSWTVTYSATDPYGASASTTFTFNVAANNAPVAPSVGAQVGTQNAALSVTLPGFSDADYDALTYSVSNLPPGLSFNASTRQISGTPTTTGSWTVTYSASDAYGGMASTTFTFTINPPSASNSAPYVNVAQYDQYALAGEYFWYEVPADTFVDPDNNPLTYTATLSSGAALPAWLNFNPTTRAFSGTPGGLTTYQYWTIRVRATDPGGLSVYDDFVLVKEPNGGGPLDGTDPVVQSVSAFGAAGAPPADGGVATAMASSDPLSAEDVYEAPVPTIGPVIGPYDLAVAETAPVESAPVVEDSVVETVVETAVVVPVAQETVAGADVVTEAVTGADAGEPVGAVYAFDMGTALAPETDVPPTGGGASTQATTLLVPVQYKEEWFTYDAENRLKLSGGVLMGTAGAANTYIGLGGSGTSSYELTYDAVGQVIGRFVKSGTHEIVYRTTYDLRGRKQYEFHAEYLTPVTFEFGGVSKQYRYDDADRLVETRSFYQNGTVKRAPNDGEGFPQGPDMSLAGWLSGAETFTYDTDGRMTEQVTLARNNGINGITWYEPWDYDDTLQRTSLTVLVQDSRVSYAGGFDSLGRVSSYTYTSKQIQNAVHTYSSTYEGWDGYLEKQVNGWSTNNNYRATTNTLTYDGFGRLIKQVENTPLPNNYGTLHDRARAYTYNGDGRVQTRREGTLESGVFTQTADSSGVKNNYLFVHAGGQQQAELKEGGQIRTWNGSTYNTPQIQGLNGSGNYAAGGGTTTALQGETLQALAQRVYGNASLWYVLADANGLSDADAPLIAGTQLSTPKITVNSNDASTFKPYDPGEAIGPTSPSLPYITPPPKKSCNVLAVVLMVVVAVVVTVFTAGALAAPAGASLSTIMATGATALAGGGAVMVGGAVVGTVGTATAIGAAVVGGFMGSVASQLVGKALGVVDHFSLRGAVASGLTAGFTAGIGATGVVAKIAGESAIAQGAVRGAFSGVSSYAANRIAGIDVSFSWKSIAASAVSGALTAGITKAVGLVPEAGETVSAWGAFRNDFATGVIGGVTSLHVRRAFGFKDRVDYGQILADAFGNAVGNAVVRRLQETSVKDQIEEFEKRIAKIRASLPEADRDNPLFYTLSDKIDPAIKRDLWAKYQAGEITFDRVLADLGPATGAFDPSKGKNGQIALSRASMELATTDKLGGLMGAMIVWADLQEIGHQLDTMAWRAMGVEGGDSMGDEGAMFAYFRLSSMKEAANPGTGAVSYGLNIGGQNVTVQADAAMLGIIGASQMYSGAMFRENRVGNIEYFNAGGHYYSTFAIAYDTALAAKGNRAEAYDIAQKLALASQIPDMIWEMDAFSQYMDSAGGSGLLLKLATRGRTPIFTAAEREHLVTVMSTLHNLAPEGKGTHQWLMDTRADAGRLVTESIKDGNYLLAGLAIHKLGDSYAHTYYNDDGVLVPYEAPHGHGVHSGTGRDPDNIHYKQGEARTYAKDLATRIAEGLGVSGGGLSSVVARGTSTWNAAFNSSLRSTKSQNYHAKVGYMGFNHEKGNQVFIDEIVAYEKSIRAQGGIGLVPDKHLHTQQGAVANFLGFGTTPATVTAVHHDLLFGRGSSGAGATSQLWEAYQVMLKRFEAYRK